MTLPGAGALLRKITPSPLKRLWRRFRGSRVGPAPSRPVWEGVYAHRRDVPKVGNGYDEEQLVNDTIRHTRRIQELSRDGRFVPSPNTPEHSLLPLLCATVGWRKGSVSVLDFGGGAGVDFIYLRNSLSDHIAFDYHVIEVPIMCERAGALYPEEPRIHFHTRLPDARAFDVVYLSTSLQYVDDYEGLLGDLIRYDPHYLFFSSLNAGGFPTYASAQLNLEGLVLPYWFLNVQDVVSYCERCGFSLVFKGVSNKEYDQSNFPEEYRMGRPCNLLFARQNSGAKDTPAR
jgi:putative methyltransferase (TIGR04325 family)